MICVNCVTAECYLCVFFVVICGLYKLLLARTLYDIKCVAALLIHPRRVTQIYIYIVVHLFSIMYSVAIIISYNLGIIDHSYIPGG